VFVWFDELKVGWKKKAVNQLYMTGGHIFALAF